MILKGHDGSSVPLWVKKNNWIRGICIYDTDTVYHLKLKEGHFHRLQTSDKLIYLSHSYEQYKITGLTIYIPQQQGNDSKRFSDWCWAIYTVPL